MKNNIPFKLFLIFIIGILFRLWFIDKPEGLWNDEYVSWYIATRENFIDSVVNMLRNCHTPLYYFYIKFWLLFFPDTDYSLRISSVIPSLLTIITMFFCGSELKDKNTGLLCALLTAISSFNIYFAQEVRLYSLLLLFCSVSLLFFIKTSKKQCGFNYIAFFISNALICAVHTLGIIYSVFNILFLLIYINKHNNLLKDKIKSIFSILKYISPFLIVAILLTPFWISIAFSSSLSQFWSRFSISKIFFSFIDYFSPIQTNIVNTPDTFLTYGISPVFLLFGIIPAAISIFAIIKAIKDKNIVLNYILVVCILYFICIIFISLTGRMILLTKYTCEIYPALILAMAYGFMLFNKKEVVAGTFIVLNLLYLYAAPDSAPKRTRPEGHYAVVSLLEHSRLKNGDIVLLTYYDKSKFERYLSDRHDYNFQSINKFNFNYFMFDEPDYTKTIKQGKRLYRDFFEKYPNRYLLDKTWEYYLKKMKKGDRIGFVFLDTVSFLSNENIQDIIDEDNDYNKTPFIFLVFSTLKNNLLYACKDNFKMDSITQAGDWTLVVYEKMN